MKRLFWIALLTLGFANNIFANPAIVPLLSGKHTHYGELTFIDQYKNGDIKLAKMSELSGFIDLSTNRVIRDTGSEAVVYYQCYDVWYMYEGCKHIVCLPSRIEILDTPVPLQEANSYIMHKMDNYFKHYDDETGTVVYNKDLIKVIFTILGTILLCGVSVLIGISTYKEPDKVTIEHGNLDIVYDEMTKEIKR